MRLLPSPLHAREYYEHIRAEAEGFSARLSQSNKLPILLRY